MRTLEKTDVYTTQWKRLPIKSGNISFNFPVTMYGSLSYLISYTFLHLPIRRRYYRYMIFLPNTAVSKPLKIKRFLILIWW